MCTDVDYIFENNFISTLDICKQKKTMLLCKVHNMAKKENIKNFNMKEYDEVKKRSNILNPECANGACQFTVSSWFKKVRGYDQNMFMWGGMDNDLVLRAKADGLKIKWIHSMTSILHQWHPILKSKDSTSKNNCVSNGDILIKKEKMFKNGNKKFIVANPIEWVVYE